MRNLIFRFRPLSTNSGFASLDDNAIRSTMPQNVLNIDDIYKNYGESLKHYSKVNFRKIYKLFCRIIS